MLEDPDKIITNEDLKNLISTHNEEMQTSIREIVALEDQKRRLVKQLKECGEIFLQFNIIGYNEDITKILEEVAGVKDV